MSQYLSMVPSQQMRLEQRLTPQLIQSMEILQLPLLALEARIQEEMAANPVLEEMSSNGDVDDVAPTEATATTQEDQADADSFDRLDEMSRDLEFDPGDLAYGSGRSYDGERDAKMDAMANTASRGENLKDSLLSQWHLLEMAPEVADAGEAIIDWMDEDGYLRRESEVHPRAAENGSDAPAEQRPLIIKRTSTEIDRLMEEISLSRTPLLDRHVLDEALDLVHTLEPIGVGARDLTECLLIQLHARGDFDPFHETLVRDHLVELGRNQFPQVSRKTGRSIDDIKDALKVIGRLQHHPGLLVGSADLPRISPDVMIEHDDDGDGYTVRLTRGNMPRLRISSQYKRMLKDKQQDKAARDFLRSRVDAAGALIDAIHYRRERMLELARLVVERQRDFFDYGPQFLKVLRMSDVAEEFGCDPSTISRTVDGKYVQSPRGIHPLRMFFTGGMTDESGEAVSWDSIKAKMKQVIDAEDKSKPLSDDEIAAKLSEVGTPVARRTVAKYRSQLNIPPARQRREF